jgi:hypothetical protein
MSTTLASFSDITMTFLAGAHSNIRAITEYLKEHPEDTPKVITQLDMAVASAEVSRGNLVDALGGRIATGTISPPKPLALPGPVHEDMKTSEGEKAKKKAKVGRRRDLPAHLKVPHVCPGKRFGCTKVTYGNSHMIHEHACKFLKAGLKAEKNAEASDKVQVKKTVGAKKKKAAA